MKTKLIILFTVLISFISKAQSIYKSSTDSGGASVSVGNLQVLYTIGEVNVQELSAADISVSEGFINAEFRILLDAEVFLQGPVLNPDVEGQMNDNLRNGNFLPTTSPYTDAATCNVSVFSATGSNAIVDWVWVELRAANDNTKIVNARSALLQRDGDIVNLDGLSNLTMTAAPTNYYVVVNHRNHLGAMSANTIGLSDSSVTTVNFRDNSFLTFGNDAQVQLASNTMALWAGNANGDDRVRYQGSANDANDIKDQVLAHPDNGSGNNLFFYFAYDNADIDMDSRIRYQGSGNDANLIKDIVLSHPDNGTLNNLFFFLQQLINN